MQTSGFWSPESLEEALVLATVSASVPCYVKNHLECKEIFLMPTSSLVLLPISAITIDKKILL